MGGDKVCLLRDTSFRVMNDSLAFTLIEIETFPLKVVATSFLTSF